MCINVPSHTSYKWTRHAVLVITGLEATATFIIVVTVIASGQVSSEEALSRSLGWAILSIDGLPFLTMTVPALLLAVLNRYLHFALVLSVLMIPAVWVFRQYA
ncbi:MAG: hypothetical protein WBX25_27150 [Rhodomicrobium sp.]